MAEPREVHPVTFFDGGGPVVTKNFSTAPQRVDPVEEAVAQHPSFDESGGTPAPPDSEPYPTPQTPTPHPDGPRPLDQYPDDLIPAD